MGFAAKLEVKFNSESLKNREEGRDNSAQISNPFSDKLVEITEF